MIKNMYTTTGYNIKSVWSFLRLFPRNLYMDVNQQVELMLSCNSSCDIKDRAHGNGWEQPGQRGRILRFRILKSWWLTDNHFVKCPAPLYHDQVLDPWRIIKRHPSNPTFWFLHHPRVSQWFIPTKSTILWPPLWATSESGTNVSLLTSVTVWHMIERWPVDLVLMLLY